MSPGMNLRRYERLHYLFGTLRREQLELLREVLDASQWIELMTLYREMAAECAEAIEEEALAGPARGSERTDLARRA